MSFVFWKIFRTNEITSLQKHPRLDNYCTLMIQKTITILFRAKNRPNLSFFGSWNFLHRILWGNGQARSQDLEKGGAILKEWEKCKQPWPKFLLSLNQFHTVCPKIETKFLGKLGNSKVFSAQNKVVSKKKKKVCIEIESDFSAEIRNSKVFSAQH